MDENVSEICSNSRNTSVSVEERIKLLIINDFYAPQTRVLRWTGKSQKRNVYPKFVAAQFGFLVVFVKSLLSLSISSVFAVCKGGAPEVMFPNHSVAVGRELPVAMPV